MRSRISRVAVLVCGLAIGFAAVPSAAGATARAGALTDEYCQAFGDFYGASLTIQVVVSLASTFSEGSDDPNPPDPDELRATFLMVLSPKLESVAATLSHGGDRPLNRGFRRQRKVFHRGVALLRGAGFTKKHIAKLRETEITNTEADLNSLLDEVDVTEAEIEEAARKFEPEVDKLGAGVDRRFSESFDRTGAECGVLSSSVDCDAVFSKSEAEQLLGVSTEQDEPGCDFEATEGDGVAPEAAVEVYESDRAFGVLTESVDGQSVSGVGDEAVSFEGFSAYLGVKSCGRTLIVRDGAITVVVALCLADDEPVADEQLVEIAQGVIDRLAG